MRVDDQVGDALLPAFPGSGPDEREEDVGVAGVRRPDLLTADDVLVAVAAAGGAQAGQVRACFRFRVALGPYRVTAEHRGQPAAFLLRGAVLDDGGGGDVQAGSERPWHAGSGELLLVDHLAGEWQLHAAELARPAGTGVAVVEQRGQPRLGPGDPLARVFRRASRVMRGKELAQPGAEGVIGLCHGCRRLSFQRHRLSLRSPPARPAWRAAVRAGRRKARKTSPAAGTGARRAPRCSRCRRGSGCTPWRRG